jgi:phosphate transport system substrate-binding protein
MGKRRTTTLGTGIALALGLVLTTGGCAPEGERLGSAAAGNERKVMLGSVAGAGASFPAPLFDAWIDDFMWHEPFTSLSYLSIGSGGGIEGFLADEVDFGSSEKYLTDEQLAQARLNRGCEPLQFPVVFGSVLIAFNDPLLDGLVLDAVTIARIYDRKITRYDDPRIAALNPDRALPDREIVPMHRADGSGTTYVFTHYLSHEVPFWRAKYGQGATVEWADGVTGGDGNEQVTAKVIETPGGLGYVNQAYALKHGLATARVVNADGHPVRPTLEATTAASELAEIPEGFQFDIDDIGGEGYPITGTNWIFAYSCGYDEETAALLRTFWSWVLTEADADEIALDLGYAPMGPELRQRVLAEVERIAPG